MACVALVFGLVLGTVPAAVALSGEPTQLGVPQVPPASDPIPPYPPAGGTQPGSSVPSGGIEAAPLPPLQPAPAPATTSTLPPGDANTATPPLATPPGSFPSQPGTTAPTPIQPEILQPGTPQPGTPQSGPTLAGLGADLWDRSEVSRLMSLVPRLPAPVTTPALRDLQIRLLSTDAASAGASADLYPLQPLRADKLYQMGFADEALGLTRGNTTASSATDPHDVVAQMLTANNDAAACLQVDAVLASGQALDAFFRRALIFCQIKRQLNDAASLGLGLLRETGDDDAITSDFISLAALANGETKRKPKLKATPDAINAALMKTAGIAAPGATSAAPVPVGVAGALQIARDSQRSLPERVAAAEQAFRDGLMPAGELGDLYLQMPAGNANPTTAIALSDTAEMRAQLYQEARRSNQPATRAKAIDAALKQAHRRGDYLNQAQLYLPFADGINPSHDLIWFAPEAARLMFLAGKPDKGGYWLNTVAANPTVFSRPGEREGLELLGRIAGLQGNLQNDPVAAWQQASGTANARIDLLYALLSGLNEPIANAVAGAFPAAPIVAVGSPSAEIAAAASGNRRGETILLALLAIDGDRAIAADPATLATALRSLGAIGMAGEARSIAREIAVLAGL